MKELRPVKIFDRVSPRSLTLRLSGSLTQYKPHVMKALAKDEEDAKYPDLYDILAESGFLCGRKMVPDIYLRFGEPPQHGRSLHVLRGRPDLEGVSVFDCWETRDGHFFINTRGAYNRRLCALYFGAEKNRDAFTMRGIELRKTGPANERLIRNIRDVERVPSEAIIFADFPSYAMEVWNELRGGPLEGRLPELKRTDPNPLNHPAGSARA